MNTIDRFSASDSDSSRNRHSVDTGFTIMSEERRARASSASSMATDGDTRESEHTCPRNQWSDSEEEEERPDDFLELSDEPPTQEQLEEAGNIPILDAEGNARPFRSLYQGPEHQGQRQLLIFIRHFYCGACQAYIQRLCETVTPSAYFALSIPTTITIIGLGKARLIPAHLTKTHCPFRMYTDPTRKLYKLFSMPTTMKWGPKPDYIPDHAPRTTYNTFAQMFKAGRKDALAGGPMSQVGGEFLFEDGEPIWCHRMQSIRGHADFKTLRRVLDLPEEEDSKTATSTPEKEKRRGVSKSTHVEDERPRGLRLVYEGPIAEGQIPRARLARESREIG